MRSDASLRIIKLGGSLLELPDLRSRFHSWLDAQSPALSLIVAGGGQAVESIRELDAIHHFAPKFSHWLCVDLMNFTATLACELLGVAQLISEPNELDAFRTQPATNKPRIGCIQPSAYYTPSLARQSNCQLPESWDCTSDSIAAWLAESLAADQLVLLKSIETELPLIRALSTDVIKSLASRGVVDRIFPSACQNLSDVRIINLRTVA